MTGAGMSAESGVPTFRGTEGLWNNVRPEELATPEAFRERPAIVWQWYEWRRSLIRGVSPHAGYRALADLQTIAGIELTLVTQNVDDLHRRAGSSDVLEVHGNLFRVRCVREQTRSRLEESPEELPPHCSCGSLLRPDVVWFGETLPAATLDRAARASTKCDLFLLIGTSGVVYPAAGLVSLVRRGRVIEINPESTPLSRLARFSIREKASIAIPPLVSAIREVS